MTKIEKPWSVVFVQVLARVSAAVCFIISPLALFSFFYSMGSQVSFSNFMGLLVSGLLAASVDIGIEYAAKIEHASTRSADALSKIVESQSKRSAK